MPASCVRGWVWVKRKIRKRRKKIKGANWPCKSIQKNRLRANCPTKQITGTVGDLSSAVAARMEKSDRREQYTSDAKAKNRCVQSHAGNGPQSVNTSLSSRLACRIALDFVAVAVLSCVGFLMRLRLLKMDFKIIWWFDKKNCSKNNTMTVIF
jgi:hypothetical protein